MMRRDLGSPGMQSKWRMGGKFLGPALALLLLASAPGMPLLGQASPPDSSLQDRALEFAQAWVNSDVDDLEAMMAPSGIRLQLQEGENILVTPPQAAASIGSFMKRYEGGEAELLRASPVGENPGEGFAEFQWVCQVSGLQAPVIFSLFVALRWNEPEWIVTEIRLLS